MQLVAVGTFYIAEPFHDQWNHRRPGNCFKKLVDLIAFSPVHLWNVHLAISILTDNRISSVFASRYRFSLARYSLPQKDRFTRRSPILRYSPSISFISENSMEGSRLLTNCNHSQPAMTTFTISLPSSDQEVIE